MRIQYHPRKTQPGETPIYKLEASEIVKAEFLHSDDWQAFNNGGLSDIELLEMVRRNTSELLSAAAALELIRRHLRLDALADLIGG